MKAYKVFTLIIILALSSCQYLNQKDSKKSDDEVRIIKSYYEKSGALKSEITVKGNKKHGIAKKYYPTGELHTKVYYLNGVKEGKTVWYYKNGQPYRVTPYVNGKMHGIRKKYYENGKLWAEIPYKNGKLIEGTQEFKENGDLIPVKTKISFDPLNNLKYDNEYILRIKLIPKHSEVVYFEEETSTEGNQILTPIKVNVSGTGILKFNIPKGESKMTVLKIYAKFKTKLGNPVLISTSYNFVVENR